MGVFLAFMQALPAFLQILPEFLQICLRLMGLVERIVSYAQENDLSKWIENLEKRFDELERAQTPQEKLSAAHNLSDVLSSFKRVRPGA
jgi:hypothetical protein